MNGKIIFCDTVQVSTINGATSVNIKKPLSIIDPVAVPSNYSFAVYGCVSEIKHVSDEQTLTMNVILPENQQLNKIDIPLNRTPLRSEGDMYLPVEMAIDFRNIVIPAEGDITAILLLNDEEICRASIEVKVKMR